MKREKNLSLILPVFNLFVAAALFCFSLVTDGYIIIATALYLIGCGVSVFLVSKNRLRLGKYIPFYILTVIIFFASFVTAVNFYDWLCTGYENYLLTVGLPVLAGLITALIFIFKKGEIKEKIAMILLSPIFYFVFLSVVRIIIY